MKSSPSKKENKPRTTQITFTILLTTLLLLAGGTVAYLLLDKHGSPSAPKPSIGGVNQPNLRLNTIYPTTMPIQTSVVVEVVLVSVNKDNLSSIPVEKSTVVSSKSEPQGSPTAPLARAFGQAYTPTLSATLTSDAFKISSIPPNVQPQSLDQPFVKWKWSIFSLNTNNQVLDVTVFSTLHSKKNPSDVIGPFIIAEQELLINVIPLAPTATPTPMPFIEPGHIDIGNLITEVIVALLGAGGLVTIFILWLIKRSKITNRTHSTQTEGVNDEDKNNHKPKVRNRRRRNGH